MMLNFTKITAREGGELEEQIVQLSADEMEMLLLAIKRAAEENMEHSRGGSYAWGQLAIHVQLAAEFAAQALIAEG